MKTLVIILIGFTLLSACKEDMAGNGIPDMYWDYFSIVDANTSQDLFLSNNEYHPDSLQLLVTDVNGQIVRIGKLTYTKTDTAIIFGPLDFHEFNLLEFKK